MGHRCPTAVALHTETGEARGSPVGGDRGEREGDAGTGLVYREALQVIMGRMKAALGVNRSLHDACKAHHEATETVLRKLSVLPEK